MSLKATLEFEDYSQHKGCKTGARTHSNSIQLKEQNTSEEGKKGGKKSSEERMWVNYRHAWQLNTSICAELRPVGHHRTVTHTHPPTLTKLSPKGVVIKAFMGMLIEG